MDHEIQFLQSLLMAMVLSGLFFAMITAVLYTLAVQMNRAIRIHNLVRETKLTRVKYMADSSHRGPGR